VKYFPIVVPIELQPVVSYTIFSSRRHFDNFSNSSTGDVLIKYKGSHSFLYNVKTGTVPVVVHGNGPIKVEQILPFTF